MSRPGIGIGFDAHRFAPGRPLLLGGVRIASEAGLEGHSDGDVLCHAIADALLGAAGLGDIGTVFPGTPEWAGAGGLEILGIVAGMLQADYVEVAGVDAVVIAQRPAIAPHRRAIAEAVASALGIPATVVGVKGTTTDGMGFTGRGEGIVAQAVARLR